MYDLIIKNVQILDGNKTKLFIGDIYIKDKKIIKVDVGENTKGKTCTTDSAATIIDGKGLHVSPGFIDPHSHSDQAIGEKSCSLSRLSQGITTEVVGLCGISLFPVYMDKTPYFKSLMQGIGTNKFPTDSNMTDFKTYSNYVKSENIKVNTAFYVGHGNIRMAVMGLANRAPTDEEFTKMKELLEEAMQNGCFGMSSGLIYPPGVYASSEELIELCKIVKKYNGIYVTHMRCEADNIVPAVKEAMEVAYKSGVKLWLSHIKVMGVQNWSLSKNVLELVNKGIEDGLSISMDQYPYNDTCTLLSIPIPPWHLTDGLSGLVPKLTDPDLRKTIKEEMTKKDCGYSNNYQHCNGFDNILVTMCPNVPEVEGKTIAEYAKSINKDPFDTYFDLLIASEGKGAALYKCIGDEDIFRFIDDPNTVVGTDGIIHLENDKVHPRTFGTFPRAIKWFVKEAKLFSLEDMIYKMTYLTAQKLSLTRKGLIEAGFDADLVIFNYDELSDEFDASKAFTVSKGIKYVLVNGKIAYQDGKLHASNNGEVICLNNN